MRKKVLEAGMEQPLKVPSLKSPAEVSGGIWNRETSKALGTGACILEPSLLTWAPGVATQPLCSSVFSSVRYSDCNDSQAEVGTLRRNKHGNTLDVRC